MPTYEYLCSDCGHDFEIRQSMSDDALTVCPECGGNLRKQFGSVGVTFKGSGFYRTDSRSGKGSTSSASGSGKSGKTAATKTATPKSSSK